MEEILATEELIRQARTGQSGGMESLVRRFENYLAMLARLHIDGRLQGKVDASDVVQETLLQAHRDFPAFRGTTEGEFVSWLRRIMAHTLANLVRRHVGTQRRDVRLERRIHDELDQTSHAIGQVLVAPDTSPSRQAVRQEEAVFLANALAELPDLYREVVVLNHLQGRSLSEIAARLGKTVDSVEKLRARALIELSCLLGDSR